MLAEGMLADIPHLRADNHPHNFYLQLLAETGIVGTITGIFFYGFHCMDLLHGAFQGTWEHRSDYGLYCSLGNVLAYRNNGRFLRSVE